MRKILDDKLFTQESLNGLSPVESYIYGLLLADGHFSEDTRNRGRIDIELSVRDEDIIDTLCLLLNTNKYYRHRATNFKADYNSVGTRICKLPIREIFKSLGFPVGNKSLSAKPPTRPYSERDFWRGFIDGNGSIGFTATNIPFISLVIKSEDIKNEYLAYISGIIPSVPSPSRNKRDNVYNATVTRSSAIILSKELYQSGDICIKRKEDSARSLGLTY